MKTIAYVGRKNDFFRFLQRAFDGEIAEYPTLEAAGADALAGRCAAVIGVAPEHELLPSLSYKGMACYAQLRRQNVPVYVEMYDSGDYNSAMLFGYCLFSFLCS